MRKGLSYHGRRNTVNNGASLAFNFLNGQGLDPRITFTRASTATFFDSTGTLQSAAINAPRFDYNPATLAARGLLIEEQRTNSILQSQDFTTTWLASGTGPAVVTANTTTSLDGAVNADTVSGTATGSDRVQQTVTVAASTTYVISFFVKNSTSLQSRFHVSNPNSGTTNSDTYITWSGSAITGFINQGTTVGVAVALPNNWWRVYFVFTTNASDAGTATVRFYPNTTPSDATYKAVFLWGAQLEAGAFPTSYIPTTTTALTRSADVASVNTLSPWFNATEGTIYAELMRPSLIPSGAFANAWALSDNTNNERFIAYNTGTGATMDAAVTDGGVSQATLFAPGAITANTTIKTAFAYAVNDFAWVRDAGAVQTDTSGTLPTVDRLYIGANSVGTGQWTGWIRRLTAYPRRLSNAELVSITT